MPRTRRLSLLLVPLVLFALTHALPGRAQQAETLSPRYAFADTTLLRDTLGLHFPMRLFPLADSLQMTPDTLRALVIRYRLSMDRLVFMADSMGVPVDSVGPKIYAERFNPLVSHGNKTADEFHYTSGYTIGQTNTAWTNGSDYHMQRGITYLTNSTNIDLETYKSAGFTSLRQTRETTTESGMKVSGANSLGGRLHLLRYDSKDSPTSGQHESLNELGFTGRTMLSKSKAMLADLSAQAGYLDDNKVATEIKKGLSGRMDAHVKNQFGHWLTHDLTGSVSSDLARTREPDAPEELRAVDASTNLSGTFTALASAPVGLTMNYSVRRTRVDNPITTTLTDTTKAPDSTLVLTPRNVYSINHIRQSNDGLGTTVRWRVDNDHTLSLVGNLGQSTQSTGSVKSWGGKLTARWTLFGWATDANYGDTRTHSLFPRHFGAYGYNEDDVAREADAQFTRSLTPKIIAKLTSSISLGRYRYAAFADSATPPSPRDAYSQSLRVDAQYNHSEAVNTGVALQLDLNRSINLDPLTTASNNDTRSYRAEWRWNWRLIPGLTASQINLLTADYNFYTFAPLRNTLTLGYNNTTTVSTVLTPHLTVDLQQVTQDQPRGNYGRLTGPQEVLQPSDESRNTSLRANITYTPVSAISFQLTPNYQASQQSGTTNGVQQKQRDDRSLNFSGGVNLNLHVGKKGTLTGNLARSFVDQRTISYDNGLPQPTPHSIQDYWVGSLQLTWQL